MHNVRIKAGYVTGILWKSPVRGVIDIAPGGVKKFKSIDVNVFSFRIPFARGRMSRTDNRMPDVFLEYVYIYIFLATFRVLTQRR